MTLSDTLLGAPPVVVHSAVALPVGAQGARAGGRVLAASFHRWAEAFDPAASGSPA